MAERNQCAHMGCSCTVADDQKYCSAHCESLNDKPEVSCECGHPGCAGKAT